MKNIKMISRQALVAGLYFVLTLTTSAFSYGAIQVRIAEVLVLLCIYKKEYIIGVSLGCFLSNLFSPMFVYDITLGLGATIISCVLIYLFKNKYIVWIFPVLFNGLLVGLELYLALELPFIISALEVMAGELIAMIIGIIALIMIEKNTKLMKLIQGKKEEI